MVKLLPVPRLGRAHELLFPARLVRNREAAGGRSARGLAVALVGLVVVTNLLLYAVPPAMLHAERWLAVPPSVPAVFLNEPARAELFRIAATFAFLGVTTFGGFYVVLSVTGHARNRIDLLESFADGTGIYLATWFAALQYFLSLPSGQDVIGAASAWLVHLPLRFLFGLVGVSPERLVRATTLPFRAVPTGVFAIRPATVGPVGVDQLSAVGYVVLAALVVLTGYYLYTMYCSARIDGGAGRTTSVLAVASGLAAPYVALAVLVLSQPTY